MREYGKIAHRFWEHPELQDLDDATKLVALHLLTSRHANMLGCYHLNPAYIAADLHKPVTQILEAFQTLIAMSFIAVDTRSNWVWIKRFLAFNNFENPNVAAAAVKVLATIPKALEFFTEFAETIVELGAWEGGPNSQRTIASRDAVLSASHTQSGMTVRRLSQIAPNTVSAHRTRNPTQPNPTRTQPTLAVRTASEPSPKGAAEEIQGQESTVAITADTLTDFTKPEQQQAARLALQALVLELLDRTTDLDPDQRRAQLMELVPDDWNPYPAGMRAGGKRLYELNDTDGPEAWPIPIMRALAHLSDPGRTPRESVPMVGTKPAKPNAKAAGSATAGGAKGSKPSAAAARATPAPAATAGPKAADPERVVVPAASYPAMRGVPPAETLKPQTMLDVTMRLCRIAGVPEDRAEAIEMQHVRAMIDEDGADIERDILPTIEGMMDRRQGRAVTSLAYFRSQVGKATEAHSAGDWTPEERRIAMAEGMRRNTEIHEQRERAARAAAAAPAPVPVEDDGPGIDVVVAKAGAA